MKRGLIPYLTLTGITVFVSGNIVELAELYGGLIFGVEHRYYGLSTFENSLENENLVFLSSQQA